MIRHRSTIAVVLAVAALLFWFVSPSWPDAAEPAAKPAVPAEADFTGKVLGIKMKDGAVMELEQFRLRNLGGRAFLVGKGVDNGLPSARFYAGHTIWVAMDSIIFIVEFESVDEMKKTYKQASAPPAPPAGAPEN